MKGISGWKQNKYIFCIFIMNQANLFQLLPNVNYNVGHFLNTPEMKLRLVSSSQNLMKSCPKQRKSRHQKRKNNGNYKDSESSAPFPQEYAQQ